MRCTYILMRGGWLDRLDTATEKEKKKKQPARREEEREAALDYFNNIIYS